MGKGAGSVSIIGGADGPTSFFIAGKGGKMKFTIRIQNYFRKLKRNRIKRRITVNPHTIEEVVELLKREYGAVEVSQQSYNYLEQKKSLKTSLVMCHRPDLLGGLMEKSLKTSLVMCHRPDLLGGLMDLKPPKGEDVEDLKTFWKQIQEREKVAAEIADDIFPLDFHIYEIKYPGNYMMQIGGGGNCLAGA